ncbi:aryl-alcohol dehydrogenase-like predicted oxidoreductase [Deinococcus soli (ex Cha et al. 2016)]|uniref:Aryl-alcohol dehydrogenase-like predicted oxidoreductase n=3 Tax=Deinococcus soli (ex Cha et al. 2016) TaxID=1309411 RepID=A0ACC6KCI9_9DEIO|nr:aryl-alcohol dehydrogenase-like predicted oxidoreductase [Deinococcus soli (ex Cha et al. 2016)]MDR6327015.1 aryl-alcohol dehydrogenase-like predicted oxidoreductase [Deinococcus soli (ex Cha et al. 2016)]MDR6750259.1 aryl-alcohol dehydrogenase-like predicted oxidoreductase [Deinococcus soli (ex Cha et al. 2016)]
MSMHQRPLGRTGLNVTEIGYGAWGIGADMWKGAQDDHSLDALRRYVQLGGNFIDTAMGYGSGHSERLVGQVAREHPGTLVATKISPKNMEWPAAPGTTADEAFPGGYITDMTRASLERLGLPTIDVQQLHVWNDTWLGQGDWQDAAAQLKRDGLIRAFGISINDHQPDNAVKAVEAGAVDSVQVIYNVFDQSPQDRLLDACLANGVGVIVRVALDEGSLTGTLTESTTFPDGDWRNGYFGGDRLTQLQPRLRAIEQDLGIHTDQLAETSLRFVLAHPAVSTVIVGMRSVRNVERNAALADGRGLPQDQVARLYAHRWDRNWYQSAE